MGARAPVFHVSLIARRVEDLMLALPLISGPDFRDASIVGMPLMDPEAVPLSGLKLAFFEDDGAATPTREISAAVRDSAKAFMDAGVKVEEKRTPDSGKGRHRLLGHEAAAMAAPAPAPSSRASGSDPISPLFEKALTYSVAPAMANPTEALAAFVRWDLFRNAMLRFMENYDAVLSAVAPYPALLHGTSFDDTNRKGFGYDADVQPRRDGRRRRCGSAPRRRGCRSVFRSRRGRGAKTSRWRWWRIWKRPSAAGRCQPRSDASHASPKLHLLAEVGVHTERYFSTSQTVR